MGLIDKIFKGNGERHSGMSTQFVESQAQTSLEETKSRNAPRRDLVKLVMRETMRRHGIPSDWMDCRTLSVLTQKHKSGMHVQFLVRQGDQQLLKWVHAFQESFWEQIHRTDPTVHDWLFSVGWEFYGKSVHGMDVMPGPGAWAGQDTEQTEGDTLPGEPLPQHDHNDSVAGDLQALQALMSMPGELVDLPEPPPGKPRG